MDKNLLEPIESKILSERKATESIYSENTKKNFVMSNRMRQFIFTIMAITNLCINMDHGTIPAATTQIKKTLDVSDSTLGIFGSLVYFGTLLGRYFLIKVLS